MTATAPLGYIKQSLYNKNKLIRRAQGAGLWA